MPAQPTLVFAPSIYGKDHYGTVYYGGQWYVLLPPPSPPPPPPPPPPGQPPFEGPWPPLPPPATGSTPGLLGPLVPSGYNITPFAAEAVNYETLFVSWNPPTGPFLDFRLVRNRYGFPTDQNDGTVLLDSGGPAYPGNNYFDSNVIPGTMHYYGIYILVQVGTGQVWYRAGLTAVLAVSNYDSKSIMLLNRIPEYYRIAGVSNPLELTTSDQLGNPYVEQFMDVFGWGLDYLKTQLHLASNVNNAAVIPVNWLVNLAETVGFPYYPEVDAAIMREAVENQAFLVQSRGTLSGIEAIVTQLTGWGTDIKPGVNLMLEDDQSAFLDPTYPLWSATLSYDAGEIVAWGSGGAADAAFISIASGNLGHTPPTATDGSNSFWNPVYYSATGANITVDGPVPTPIVLGLTTVPALNVNSNGVYLQVAGGTVTVINVNGTVTGLTSGTFFVPAGGTVTLTYSVAPTTFITSFPTLLNSTSGWLNTWEPLIDGMANSGYPTNATALVERAGILSPTTAGLYTQNGLGITNNSGSTSAIELRSIARTPANIAATLQYPTRDQVIGDGIPVPFTLPRHAWYSWVEYFPGQVVSYEGMPYQALKASTGVAPPVSGIPTNEWQPVGYDARIALMLSGYTGQNLNVGGDLQYAVTPYVLWFDETGTFITSLYTRTPSSGNTPNLIAFDSFAQPNGWGSGLTTPDIGTFTWTPQVSSFNANALNNGTAVPATVNARTLETLNYGSANAFVGVTFASLPNGGWYGGLVMRWASNTSYIRVDQSFITQINGTAVTTLATHSTPFLAGDRMTCSVSGNVYTVYRNGTQVSTVTSAFNSGATVFGMVVETPIVLPAGTAQPVPTRQQPRRSRARALVGNNLLPGDGNVVATVNVGRGPQLYPLHGPVRARPVPPALHGRVSSRSGSYITNPATVRPAQSSKAKGGQGRRGVTR
jgi:hypothetical protein